VGKQSWTFGQAPRAVGVVGSQLKAGKLSDTCSRSGDNSELRAYRLLKIQHTCYETEESEVEKSIREEEGDRLQKPCNYKKEHCLAVEGKGNIEYKGRGGR